MKIRRYSDLKQLQTFKDRYEYLKIGGQVGQTTFGFDRYLNQAFYTHPDWLKARREVIIRDNGLDLGVEDYMIPGRIIVHHMNPITEEDIINWDPKIFDPEFLISVSHNTHNAIHFGDFDLIPKTPVERRPGDTCPWK